MGNKPPASPKITAEVKKWKRPAAGRQTIRTDDLDLQKHIIPSLNSIEDATLTRKITEDKVGGTVLEPNVFKESQRAYGQKSVRDASERMGRLKGISDRTVH